MERINYFEGNIGQQEVCEHFNGVIHLQAFSPTPVAMKGVALEGEAGMGKTSFLKKLHAALNAATGKDWRLVEFIPTESPTDFIHRYTTQVFSGEPTLIFVDEVHGLEHERIKQWLKRVLETENERKDIIIRFGGEEYILPADPYNHLWVCASNEDLNDEAMIGPNGRFRPLYIAPYSYGEIAKLLVLMAANFKMELTPGAVEYLSKRVKGNGRAIDALMKSLQVECMERIDLDAARRTVARDKRFPDGLDRRDLEAIIFLASRPKGAQIGEVGAHIKEVDNRANSRLRVLSGMNLVTSGGGKRRIITPEGKEYLKNLAEAQQEASARKMATARL